VGVASDVNQAFVRISGVVTTSEDIEYMQGTDTSVGTAPGRTKFDDLQMERIFNGTDHFYAWRRRIENGEMELGNLTIEMLDRGGQVVRRVVCANAWPKRWEMPEMDATSSNLAIEKITLAVADIYEDDV
jgi:phage tail-like protein